MAMYAIVASGKAYELRGDRDEYPFRSLFEFQSQGHPRGGPLVTSSAYLVLSIFQVLSVFRRWSVVDAINPNRYAHLSTTLK